MNDMIDIQKQIDYWRTGAEDDLEVAQLLVERGKIKQGLFFAHLTLEKMLKAHVCKATLRLAPKIHSLLILADKGKLSLPKDIREILAVMNSFCMEGRYPDSQTKPPNSGQAKEYMKKTMEAYQWLLNQL